MSSVIINQPQGLISTVNATTTLLGISATYTGTSEQNFFPHVMVFVYADVAGTLHFEFSLDNTNWNRDVAAGYAVSAATAKMQAAVKGPRYFRCVYINGASGQATFRLGTFYGTFAAT